MKLYISILVIILINSSSYSQVAEQYVLNANSGLPSNHVYITLKDRHGYLWMSTPKGVVKYNGYEFKIFDVSDGMASDDIWSLYEDKKGRIWLSTISDEIGYIYKDKYKSATILQSTNPVYPKYVRENKNGIIFLSKYKIEKHGNRLYFEKNDSITYATLKYPYYCYFFISKKGTVNMLMRNYVYNFGFKNGEVRKKLIGKNLLNYKVSDSLHYYNDMTHSWLITVTPQNAIYFFNTETLERKNIILKKTEQLYNIVEENDNIVIVTTQNVYKLNNQLKRIKKTSSEIDSYENINKKHVVHFLNDRLWGKVITTVNNGVYINHNNKEFIKNNTFQFKGTYVGYSLDSSRFWWDKSNQTLTCLRKDKTIARLTGTAFSHIEKIIPYTVEKSFILANNSIYVIDNKLHITNHLKGKKQCRQDFTNIGILTRPYEFALFGALIDAKVHDDSNFYIIARTVFFKMRLKGDTIIATNIDDNKYTSFCYDSLHQTYWVYNSNRLLVYNANTLEKQYFSESQLKKHGIKKIEKILIDRHERIYVKTHEKLFIYNAQTNAYKQILKDFRFNGSDVYIHEDMLIITGKAGIAFTKIRDNDIISKPILYQNIKNTLYNYITNAYINGNTVYLNTDKGVYEVKIPHDSILNSQTKNNPYRFIVVYNDSTRNIRVNDSIFIDQQKNNIGFDVINPYGNGKLRFKYKLINDTWQDLNANELFLPKLKADKYYNLKVIAYDDVWQGAPANIELYIVPYWWQTTTGKRILWICGTGLVLLLLYIIVYITRRIVIKQNARKNLKLELKNTQLALELKSIYAQINPHFIFNTLNTGLYFIKKKRTDEAYKHISAFSTLLRAYIKSSRNKYITVAEEVENLNNYILLQQTRFENKFDFEITVKEEIINHKKIPSLLLQPLVENAITHGLLNKEEKGHLTIEFKMNAINDEIICIIDDDGIGREVAKMIENEIESKTESFGSELIKELINIFNTNENIKIDIQYFDKTQPLTGTTVTITIKELSHE